MFTATRSHLILLATFRSRKVMLSHFPADLSVLGEGKTSFKNPVYTIDNHHRCRICPGIHLGDNSLWIVIASVLATMNILKAVDSDGQEITPDGSFTSGITRCLIRCLRFRPILIPLSEVIRAHIVVPFSPEMRPHASSLHKAIHQIPIDRTTKIQQVRTESCTYNPYSIMLIALSLSQKGRSQ